MSRNPQSSTSVRRFRVFDLMTPWFWIVIFWQRQYGEPWLVASIYPPAGWKKWWLHAWQWEPMPDKRAAMATDQPGAHLYEGTPRG